MAINGKKTAGALLFIGAAQFLILMMLAEFLYPGYSVANNFISDLGNSNLSPVPWLFNISVLLLGLFVIIAAYFLRKGLKESILPALLVLMGVGAIGVGLVPENTVVDIHLTFAFIAFFFGAIGAIFSYRFQSGPLKYFSVVLGAISLIALILGSGFGLTLGLGKGGMERMIVYPILIWTFAFGGYLMAQ